MTATVLREEIHAIIDTIPDQSLSAIRPLLTHLADDYWEPIIEDASPQETAMIEKGMEEYRKAPSSVTPWKSVRKR